MRLLVLPLLTLTLAPPVFASDGVLEINQTCAVNTGCFPGDAPGFPVEIVTAGSYALTGDLTLSSTVDAVLVSADRVSLDLRGFSIRCIVFGCLNGINATDRADLRLRGGSIAGFSLRGVIAGSNARVWDLVASGNGLELGERSDAARCNLSLAGLLVGARSVVRHNIVSDSGGIGISAGEATVIVGNQIRRSQSHGVFAGEASVLAENSIRDSGGVGVTVREGSLLLGNTMVQSTFLGVVANTAGQAFGYAENVFTGNGTDPEIQVSSEGVELGMNLCGSDNVCP